MLNDRTPWLLVTGLLLLNGCGDTQSDGMEGMDMDESPPTMAESAAPMEAQTVSFAAPADGATVTGPDVSVVLEVTGLRIVEAGVMDPGTGHHHIFLDADVTPMDAVIPAGQPGIIHLGLGQTEHVLEGVSPGQHRLIAVVADGQHVPLDPPVVDTIFITVVAPAP